VGVKRTTGQHPGGIIIIPKEYDVLDFSPYNYPADDKETGTYTTHFTFESLHNNLLKFDLLGHDDPTSLKMLNEITGIDIKSIPFKDEEVLKLFSSLESLKLSPDDLLGETTGAIGLPEFGTEFVRRMLTKAQPKSFADLIRISGLSHGKDV
jgi:DNA polymerase-3 subunit alpha (Gram-positive type)